MILINNRITVNKYKSHSTPHKGQNILSPTIIEICHTLNRQ